MWSAGGVLNQSVRVIQQQESFPQHYAGFIAHIPVGTHSRVWRNCNSGCFPGSPTLSTLPFSLLQRLPLPQESLPGPRFLSGARLPFL